MKLSKKLENIALGKAFYMSAILDAEKLASLSIDDKACLRRYRNGNQNDTDHIALQTIANKLAERGK
jgi:hypothetical protein